METAGPVLGERVKGLEEGAHGLALGDGGAFGVVDKLEKLGEEKDY